MEEWKVIPGYEGLYEASNLGRIRTVEGKTTSSARAPVRVWKQRVLKTKTQLRRRSNLRDERVTLWKDRTCKTMLVSRLVALAWCPGYVDGMTVNHIDGNPMNNKPDNLEWITLADNIRHGFRTGLYSAARKCTLIDSKGNAKEFRSMEEAGSWLGRSHGYISAHLKNKRPVSSASGECYGLI